MRSPRNAGEKENYFVGNYAFWTKLIDVNIKIACMNGTPYLIGTVLA